MPRKNPEMTLICLRGCQVIRHLDSLDPARCFADAGVTAGQHAVLFTCDSQNLIGALDGRNHAMGLIRARNDGAPDLAAAYVNRAALAQLMGETIDGFHRVIAWCAGQPQGTIPVVLHLGGMTVPDGALGEKPQAWLSAAYERAQVPAAQRHAVTGYLYSRLAAALSSLHCPGAQVYVLQQPGAGESVLHAAQSLIAR